MTLRQPSSFAVAIIGMAGRFPGAGSVDALWKNLCDGVDCLHISTDEELKEAGIRDWQKRHADFVRVNGVVEGAADFDAPFFGFSAHDASIVDPQHRVFLECAWEAFEDAGYDPSQHGEGVAVFAGAGANSYRKQDLGPEIDTATVLQLMVGGEKDFLATRVAYKLNLTGPAITVQTACSTSLVAVQMAWESLQSGTSTMAIAGGVSIMFPQATGFIYQEGMILSPDGYCRAFDAKAGGTTIGRGAGAVLLKPLDAAIRDHDQIYAVIRGAAINNDGSAKGGYTAPGIQGQAEVIRRAMQMADFDPSTVHYIEAHGTGTQIGDSIEIAALSQAFAGSNLARGSVKVSSLKASIGHTDIAAGVANLIKASLAVRARVLPGTMHFKSANPELQLEKTPFRISRQYEPYTGAGPMRAGISAFGIGGTNAHVCIEEWRPEAVAATGNGFHAPPVAQLFPLSANSEKALAAMRTRLAEHLEAHPELSLSDVAFTLQSGRRLFAHRCFAIASDREQLIAELRAPIPKGQSSIGSTKEPEIFFLFPGQGAQYVNMGRGLYETDTVFREALDRCADILEPILKLDLRRVFFPQPGGEEAATALLRQTHITQPALFSMEYAIAMRLLALGVSPAAMLGHSLGEYVAATVAGVFQIEHILAIVAERGRHVQSIPPGSMLAVSMAEDALSAQLPPELSIAAVNAPKQTIVSGPTDAIEAFAAVLTKQRVANAPLVTSHAFHSAMLDPIVGFTAATVAKFPRAVPAVPIISNLTGTWITDEQATDPEYYDAHLRQAVRFADGLKLLTAKKTGVFIEVGPGETLLPLARAATKGTKGFHLVSTMRRATATATDTEFWLNSVGQLWLAGVRVDWKSLHGDHHPHRVSLPTYPFERQHYWLPDEFGRSSHPGNHLHEPIDRRDEIASWFYTQGWQTAAPLATKSRAVADPALRYLVFAEPGDEGLHLLEQSLETAGQVIQVYPGAAFNHASPGRYTLRTDQPAHYIRLFEELQQNEYWPDHIIFAWTEFKDDTAKHACFARLFYLAEAIQRSGKAAGLTLSVITSDAYDVYGEGHSQPANRAAAWLATVVGTEITGLKRRVVQRDTAQSPEVTAARLLAEIHAGPQNEHNAQYNAQHNTQQNAQYNADQDAELVVLRGRHRWTPSWVPLALPAAQPAALRRHGVYIVTGGIGGIGLVLAEYLAAAVSAHLILVGRSSFPQPAEWERLASPANPDAALRQKAQALLRIQAAGGSVEIMAADVCDRQRMQQVVTHARKRDGGLAGIIHSAGIVDYTVLGATAPQAIENVFAAKAEGTGWIESVLAEGGLDFVLLCSSLSSVIPSAGLSTYGGSNAYLDGFAAAHDNLSGTRVLAINWDNWSETGMAVAAAALSEGKSEGAQEIALGISNREGGEAFALVLNAPVSQVAVSTRDLPRLLARIAALRARQGVSDNTAAIAETAHPRPELSQEYTPPSNDVEAAIADIWQELLGLERVGIHDDFFELGGHSLLGAQVIARIRERFKVDLPLRMIFDSPTPAAIAGLVLAGLDKPAVADQTPHNIEIDQREREEIEI